MKSIMPAMKKRRFIGLGWKSFLLISLLLSSMSAVFYLQNYRSLMEQFEARQTAEINSLRHHIEGIIKGTSSRLMRFGGALASMGKIGTALQAADYKKITKIVSGYASLGYELDLRRIEIYSLDATLVARWAQYGAEELPELLYRQAIEKVETKERPVVLLHCQPQCLLYAFVPVLAAGHNVGVIAIGQSIADFIIDFKLVTGADIALAVPLYGNNGAELAVWKSRIPALTNAATIMPFLQDLSKEYKDPAKLIQGQRITWNGAHYDVHLTPLSSIIPGQAGFFLLISDISERLHDIKTVLRQGVLVTFASLILAELCLLYLLRVPLHRLGKLAQNLPLLAEGLHQQVRDYFSVRQKKTKFRDEIDDLYDSAIQLSHQLEQNSQALSTRNRELAEERDFIQGLLAAAQVLVITQNKQGVIQVGNNFAAQLTGYTPDQLYGQRFVDLIANSEARQEVQNQLLALCDSDQRQMEHEHELMCKSGDRRKVVWVHTPLQQEYSDGTALLSVGLDVTERVRAESKMRWLANHDPLTSLVNRSRFIEDLTRIYDEVTRTGSKAALLVFDLDHFKEINDTSGHAAGDALLRMIADELKARARTSDIVARLGGDEFAMLMPQTDSYGAETFAKQLNDRLMSSPFVYGDKRYRVGASVGIALLPLHGLNIQEVMANADMAMFEAKRAGRACSRVFSNDLLESQAFTQNVYWKDILSEAIESKQLFFYFQPVYDPVSSEMIFYEALLRLRMPDGRIAQPSEFLPSADRAGLNYKLDCYVIDMALQALLENPDVALSINLTTAALNDAGWTNKLIQVVYEQQLDPERMIFEITEMAVIADMAKAREITRVVTELGFRFAVDDFGAGFSSLYYLKHLPVEYIKIDQSLVEGISDSEEDCDFVRAIVAMIHVYGKKVVAEGIEKHATLELLKNMEVDFMQGNYIGCARLECEDIHTSHYCEVSVT